MRALAEAQGVGEGCILGEVLGEEEGEMEGDEVRDALMVPTASPSALATHSQSAPFSGNGEAAGVALPMALRRQNPPKPLPGVQVGMGEREADIVVHAVTLPRGESVGVWEGVWEADMQAESVAHGEGEKETREEWEGEVDCVLQDDMLGLGEKEGEMEDDWDVEAVYEACTD